MTGWSARDIPELSGRVAVVTGANRGLGREVTRYLAGRGARVIMACRDEAAGEATAAALRAGGATGPLEVRPLDLASLASVEKFAAGLAGEPRLDLLANNAGLMAVDRGVTAEGFEMHIGVNHLGHFALTARLLPLLLATGGSRIVTMSSMRRPAGPRRPRRPALWERRPYDRWQSYFQSKLANLLFTLELDRRLRAARPRRRRWPPTPAAPAPAWAATAGTGRTVSSRCDRSSCSPPALGALRFVRASTDPAAQGGEYYGPMFQMLGPAGPRDAQPPGPRPRPRRRPVGAVRAAHWLYPRFEAPPAR